jgi:sugar porter (SP) family MFS transporter
MERAIQQGENWVWRRGVAAAVCSLGGFTFGYDLGALSGATRGLAHEYTLTPGLFGLTVSVSLWGAVCASPLAGRLADRLGRRRLLVLCALAYGLVAVLLALRWHWPWAMVLGLRLASGAALAGFVVVCPLYLAEIAPRARRGRFVGLFQLMTGMGVVAAFAASAALAGRVALVAEWKWCFGLGALAPALLLAFVHWAPEEPHWLLRHGRRVQADASALCLGLGAEEWPPAEMHASQAAAPSEQLFQRKYARALVLATLTAVFNQLCGVTILRVYLLDLLSSTGMSSQLSHNLGLLVAALNVLALVGGLALVDRVGRKPLLAAGSAAMAACLLLLALALRVHPHEAFYVAILVAYNTAFAASQGAVGWVYISEVFPYPVRGQGQGFAAWVHWVVNAALIWMYPVLEAWVPRSSFLLFAAATAVQAMVVLAWFPETKGRRLGEIG